jgi:hypothetical protein
MASADLTSAFQLIDRAQQEFDALKAKADAFLQEHPWGTKKVPDKDGWVLRAKIPKQPPEDWWLDLGELADNGRAALNHLIRQLIIDSGNNPDKGRPQFPIFEVQSDYFGNGGMKSNREKMLVGVAKRHRKIIDDAQPYRWDTRATEHPLSMLRCLTDRHKHRDQHVGALAVDRYSIGAEFGEDSPVRAAWLIVGNVQNPDPLIDGQTINSAYPTDQTETKFPDDAPPPWGGRTVQVLSPTGVPDDPHLVLTVAFFGDRAFKIDEIGSITPYVRDLIERFQRRIVSKSARTRPTR